MTTGRRRAAERRGHWAETAAALSLRLKGYRIAAARHRTDLGEIDLVARRGRIVAFVEVKARPTLAEALAAVTPTQRRRIKNAARTYLARLPEDADRAVRFDVIAVRPWRWPSHLADAWRPGP